MLKNIFRRKLRTLFALTGVALAVAALVALSAVTQGMLLQLEQLAAQYRGDVMVQAEGAPDPLLSRLPFDIVPKLRELPEVKAAYPVVSYLTKLPTGATDPQSGRPKVRYFLVFALPAGSGLLQRHKLLSGRYFASGREELIIGEEAARELKLKLGDRFVLSGGNFTVVGIFSTGIRLLDGSAIYSIEEFRRLFNRAGLNLVVLDLFRPDEQIPAVIQRIRSAHPDLEPLQSARVLDYFRHAALFRSFSNGISLIAVSIAALGVLNIMLMSVHERTREIGILRALGWSSSMIGLLIGGEALILALAGGAAGAALGAGGTELLIRTVDIGLVRASYPAALWLKAGLLSVIIGLAGAVLPAWRATRISPLEALRYE